MSIESPRRLFGAAGTGAWSVWCNPVLSSPAPSGLPGRWRLAMQRAAGFTGWIGLVAGPMVRSDVPKGRSSMAACGIDWIGLSVDQNRHSGRSEGQTRNPCPVERGWIPAVAGMTIRSEVPCQRAFFYRGVLSIIGRSRLRFWRLTRQCHDQSRAHRNADADPTFQTGFRYRPGRQGTHPDAPEVS